LISLVSWNNLVIIGKANANVDNIINNNTWLFHLHHVAAIFNSPLSRIDIDKNLEKDYWMWKLASKIKLFLKQTWYFVKGEEVEVDWYKVIWNSSNCPKMAHYAYFAILNKLPTRELCYKWKTNGFTSCIFCTNDLETIDQLYFDCFIQDIYGL